MYRRRSADVTQGDERAPRPGVLSRSIDPPCVRTMAATVGGGAKYMKDYEPAPLEYLGDEEFGFLVGQVFSTPGCEDDAVPDQLEGNRRSD